MWAEIAEFLKFEARKLRDIRDRALVAVTYDTMCRREELVLLLIEDIAPAEDGSGTIVIRRSKTDVTGEGATAYLPSVMQAGRWQNTRLPMRYGEVVSSLIRQPLARGLLNNIPGAKLLYGSGWDAVHPFDRIHGTHTSGFVTIGARHERQ